MTLVDDMHIAASVFINDEGSGLHHDYEVWLEELAPHAPIDQYWHNRISEDACRERSDGSANAPLKRAAETGCASQVMGYDTQRWWR